MDTTNTTNTTDTMDTTNTTNILILGNGAREEVIREKLQGDSTRIYLLNPNKLEDVESCSYFSIDELDLVIPSTEKYLCNGAVDYFLTERNIPSFGPTKKQSALEGSKHYSKSLMKELNIPTPEFKFFSTFKFLNKCFAGSVIPKTPRNRERSAKSDRLGT